MIHLKHFLKGIITAKPAAKTGGFSIAELIVVIAIFSFVTAIAFFDQGRLSSNVLITNLAYETALAVREAQVYGIGVKNFDSNEFVGKFGAYIDLVNAPTSIVLFSDIDEDNHYDAGTLEAKYQYAFTQQRGNKIVALCINSSQNFECTSGGSLSDLHVVFKRPSPEAHFYISGTEEEQVGRAYIVVNNVDNDNCHVVIIEQTGQIRVENGKQENAACVNEE